MDFAGADGTIGEGVSLTSVDAVDAPHAEVDAEVNDGVSRSELETALGVASD